MSKIRGQGPFKVYGDGWTYAFSPMIALALAVVLSPLLAYLTKGRYYLARPNLVSGPEAGDVDLAETLECVMCSQAYERPDMADCPFYTSTICSLCCSLDKSCHDMCKKPSGAVNLGMPAVGSSV